VITRRAKSFADTPGLPESDWESVGGASRIMLTKTVAALYISRRDSALPVLMQPIIACKVPSYGEET
jgi:hypothetical protein